MQVVVQNELNKFQDRLNRCGQSCQDEISDHVTGDIDRNSPKFQQLEMKMHACMGRCVDKQIAYAKTTMLNKLRADIDEVIKRHT